MFPASKPSIVDRGGRTAEDPNGRSAPLIMPPALPVPTVKYGSDDDGDDSLRLCRICLESDHPEDLIAPCLCKGSSKWVHRTCLDLWRAHEQDRAFATCTECQFQYRYEKQPQEGLALDRRTRFCLFVSRDACLVTAAVQAVIVLMGLLVYAVLHADEDLNFVCPAANSTDAYYSDSTNQQGYNSKSESFGCRHEYVTYYLLGLFGLLICMGMFGSVFLCSNGCRVPDLSSDDGASNANYLAQGDAPDSHDRDMRQQRSQFYSHHRQRQHARREREYPCWAGDPCFCCDMCCYRGYYPYYYGYYGPGYYGGDSTCCCCCCDGAPSHHHRSANVDGDCCCCPIGGGNNDNDCNGEGAHILLIVLLVVAIVMAIIGVFVGVFVGVMIAQRILQRHMFLLQKQRLVEQFQVADLSKRRGYSATDVEFQGLVDPHQKESRTMNNNSDGLIKPSAPPESELPGPMAPSAPPESEVLNAENENHLRKLGLLQ